MASYKQPCIQCGTFINRDATFCPMCGSRSAFGYHCPNCKKKIVKGQRLCSECGISLYIICPCCGKNTFLQDRCENCGVNLT